jgi:uncharacterized protein (TIGR03084 family)
MDVVDDLAAEEERLEEILTGLTEEQWLAESGAPGWSVADVVLHLAQSEEAVVASATGDDSGYGGALGGGTLRTGSVDATMEELVRAERAAPGVVFERWRVARREALDALRAADPQRPLPWVTASHKPRTLATTRLTEHWAHGLDVTGPSRTPYPDTDRLRHVAWLAHSTLAYAFTIAGHGAQDVFCELTGPDGDTWRFGPEGAESTITGALGEFCRVGVRRLAPEDSDLVATGPHGHTALRLLRTYAA